MMKLVLSLYLLGLITLFYFNSGAEAYNCCLFSNRAMPSMQGVLCTSMRCPSGITGWKSIGRSWFVVDCKYCTTFKPPATRHVNPSRRILSDNEQSDSSENLIEEYEERAAEEDNTESDASQGNPVKCCLYIKKESYYTEPVYTSALNPNTGGICPSSQFGIQLTGQWYVSSMYNQCFFRTRIVQ